MSYSMDPYAWQTSAQFEPSPSTNNYVLGTNRFASETFSNSWTPRPHASKRGSFPAAAKKAGMMNEYPPATDSGFMVSHLADQFAQTQLHDAEAPPALRPYVSHSPPHHPPVLASSTPFVLSANDPGASFAQQFLPLPKGEHDENGINPWLVDHTKLMPPHSHSHPALLTKHSRRKSADSMREGPTPPDANDRSGGIEEELLNQNLYKTELCRSWRETGACRYGHKCQFAHGEHELRLIMRHPKYKTEPCKTYAARGSCPYGNRCRFLHPKEDTSASPAKAQWSSNWPAPQEEANTVTRPRAPSDDVRPGSERRLAFFQTLAD